jgi:type I restriction enzyme M protein
VAEKFATIDLHPDTVSNAQMGTVFEELIRKFAELSNETAGEHFTPREVIRLMVSRLFKNEDFGYRTITVERPERDAADKIVKATKGKLKGKPQPEANLRDTENVPLSEDVQTYFKREVLPHAPDAWIDHEKTKVGYEIPFNRHFYVFKPPRELAVIDAELKIVTDRILTMIGGLTK